MIPKIIHYCWLSDEVYPPKIQRCMDSWGRFLTDYEIRRWSMMRIREELEEDDRDSCAGLGQATQDFSRWVQEAFDAKKYAFVSDWVRLYALKKYGGIYLDSDVEVFKSFNDLLCLPYFLGFEKDGCPETAVMGGQKGCIWAEKCLAYYKGRPFFLGNDMSMRKYAEKGEYISDFRYSVRPSPWVILEMLSQFFQLVPIDTPQAFISDDHVICLLPSHYFSFSKSSSEYEKIDRYCVHHGVGAWKPHSVQRNLKIWATLESVVGYKVTAAIVKHMKKVISIGRK